MAFATSTSWFPKTLAKEQSGTVNFAGSTKKIMIVTAIPTGIEEFVSSLTELSASGYTSGYGNSGRKTMAGTFTFTANEDGTPDTSLTYSTPVEWASLGTNESVKGFVILTETGGADTSSIPWIWLPVAAGTYVLSGATQTLTLPSPIMTHRLAS
jgi:hypothetical protein